MKHSDMVTVVWLSFGALLVPRAMADAFSWNNSGSGSAYWGNTNKWTKTAGTGSQTVPSIAGDTLTVPNVGSGINIAVTDAAGAATTFTVHSISISQVTQSRKFTNPATGTSMIVIDSGTGASSNTDISNSMSGGDKRLVFPNRVIVSLNNNLRVTHTSNLNPATVFDGVIQNGTAPSPSFTLTGGNVRAVMSATNTFSGGVNVTPNQNRSKVNANTTRFYAQGGADATGSATGTGAVTVTGATSGDDNNAAWLVGSGTVGQTGRTGTTLTASGSNATSSGRVSPGGTLNNDGGHTETVGTLTVNGDVQFGSHGRLYADFSNTTSDALRINGGIGIGTSDTTLILARLGGTTGTLATVYELVHYTEGGLTGTFATETLPAELTDAGYRVFYNQPSSLGAGYAAITVAKPPAGTVLTIY